MKMPAAKGVTRRASRLRQSSSPYLGLRLTRASSRTRPMPRPSSPKQQTLDESDTRSVLPQSPSSTTKSTKRARATKSKPRPSPTQIDASLDVDMPYKAAKLMVTHNAHNFTSVETMQLRTNLLKFYDTYKRDLPWRKLAESDDTALRAYAVLVSEVMLQQTQVVTVKTYYKKWMARWPSFEMLSRASLEEVNEMWAGLGYYGRARRLFESSKKIVDDLDGVVPNSATKLQEVLPGVGRYTAGAVASISFGERVAAVDGNVIRVLARMRAIGGDSSSPAVSKEIWNIAEEIVDLERPGDFNQAMMELGAVICTPKNPKCGECPVKNSCLAYKANTNSLNGYNMNINDIEILPDCLLCLPASEPWDCNAGVMNFPRKAKKAPPRHQQTAVAILHRKTDDDEYLLMKRPSSGLLANLWEFPSCILESDTPNAWIVLEKELRSSLNLQEKNIKSKEFISNITHIFSHIHQVYVVYAVQISKDTMATTPEHYQAQQWVTKSQLLSSAVSTGVKKIFKNYAQDAERSSPKNQKRCNSKSINDQTIKKCSVITDFFHKS